MQHFEKLDIQKINTINFITFVLSFSYALMAYIISSYLKQILGSGNVSLFFIIGHIIVLVILLNLHKFIKKFGKSFVFLATLFLLIGSSLLLSVIYNNLIALIALMIHIILFSLYFIEKDIILELYSIDKKSGRIRGLHLTIMNIGFILGPLISMRVLETYNFQIIFFIQFLFFLPLFFIALLWLRKIDYKFRPLITINEFYKKILKRKDILRIYYVSFILEFFYFIMIVYMPIYLRDIGMPWNTIGIVFLFMLTPFVLLEYPIGLIADKKIGEKELIIAALFIIGCSVLSIYFINSLSIYIWIITLIITRIGAALLEVLRDSYFYKRIDGRDIDIINFFQTSRSVGFIIAAVMSGILLLFLELKFIFILTAIIAFSGLWSTWRLVDSK